MKRLLVCILMVAAVLFLAVTADAQDKKPDATVKLSQGQIAVGIGFSWGGGTLTYQGKEYPFKITGLSIIDVGVTRAEASGDVYNLTKLEDFNGTYTSVAAEGTLGGGGGVVAMKNQNGVTIKLVATTQGANIKLALDGVKYTLK